MEGLFVNYVTFLKRIKVVKKVVKNVTMRILLFHRPLKLNVQFVTKLLKGNVSTKMRKSAKFMKNSGKIGFILRNSRQFLE